MKIKISTYARLLLLAIFAHITVFTHSQSLDFINFDSNKGLPQNFVYCMAQDHSGYLWIGTGEGLVRYDGINFNTYTVRDSLTSDFIHSIYVDHKNTIWIGHKNGTLSYYENNIFHKIVPNNGSSSPIRNIVEDDNQNIWAIVQNSGLIKIDKDKKVTTYFQSEYFGNKLFYSLAVIDPQSFLLGTSDGLQILHLDENGQPNKIETVDSISYTNVNAIKKRNAIDNEYWIATEDEGFYLFKYNKRTAEHVATNNLCIAFNIQDENIIDILEDKNGNLLLATWGNGIIKLFFDPASQTFKDSFQFSTENGLSHNYIKQILNDNEGNCWVATYGSGISVLVSNYFIRYDLEDIGFKQQKAISVIANKNNLWIGLDNGLLKVDPFCFTNHEYYDTALGIPNDKITGFKYDSNGKIWVASENKGLYYREANGLKFHRYNFSNDIIDNKINDLDIVDNKILLATIGGFFTIDINTNKVEKYTTRRGLPHNNINFVYVDNESQVWIGPKSSGLCRIDSTNIEIHKLTQTPIDVSGMTEDKDGNYWLSTIGKGVLKYNNDTLVSISVIDGLTKNYCYDIICDKNNKLWVCHWPGLTSIDLESNQIRKFGYEQDMGGDFYRLWEDREKNIWLASSKGIIKYFPDNDTKNMVPPMLNFTNISISGKSYTNQKEIVLPYPYGKKKYDLRFDFIGISYKDPDAVTYQYMMQKEGDDVNEWIELGKTNFRKYEFLPDGTYTFKVMAVNADGVKTHKSIAVKIFIRPPFWKKLWFYLTVLVLVGGLIYWIIKYRERTLKLQKELLEQEVASQTVLLRRQKAEIEQKNQDITDSITYAKRIQKSILPPIDELINIFPESFIFFNPRDIVSGDFYWFKRKKDIFVLCCADCTGHGVPGAFMSMIGTTLLNDIFKLPTVNSPSDMLERLDNDIRVLLQKGVEEHSNDGMDISIIEINLSTRKLRLASAKRPVFLFINNELTTYNGTRRSIGDDDLVAESRFVNYEYDCSKGDSIYLFSDGYSDQFGGPREKKIMKTGIKKLLEDIHGESMKKQGEIVRDYFFRWKGDLEQIDDVLFMGIKM